MAKKKGSSGSAPASGTGSPAVSTPTGASPALSPSPSGTLSSSSGQIPIAISIGSSYSCVAFYKDDKAQIIPNEDGERVTPSCVAFTNEEMFAGTPAKSQYVRNRNNTIVEFTQVLGKSFEEVEAEKHEWGHKVINKDGKPYFEVEFQGKSQEYSPEDIVSVMIKKMKDIAELYLGTPISEASLTVPFDASESYKSQLVSAASRANLRILALIKEPLASVLAFGIGQAPEEFSIDRNILVFDLGGTFLDMTLVSSFGGLYEVVSHRKERLGGKDFDHKLAEHFAKEFERKTKANMNESQKAVHKLRHAVEHTKRSLSNSATAHISVESLHEGHDFHGSINRSMFDMVTGPLARKCMALVQEMLEAINMTPEDVTDVILAGGGSSILSIQKYFEALFSSSTLRRDTSPDETPTRGAVFESSLLTGAGEKMHDVTETKGMPCTLGIQDAEGNMIPLLKKNCPLPVRRKIHINAAEGQDSLLITFYAVEDKEKVCELALRGIKKEGKASEEGDVEVSATVEEDGTLKIAAIHHPSAVRNTLVISPA